MLGPTPVLIGDRDRDELLRLGAEIDESDQHIEAILENLIYHPARLGSLDFRLDANICAPRFGTYAVAIPGSVFDHCEIKFDDGSLEQLLTAELGKIIHNPTLIPAVPHYKLNIRLKDINYTAFNFIDHGYMTTPFSLVDDTSKACFFFDCDLQYSVLCCEDRSIVAGTAFEDVSFWKGYFDKNFPKLFPTNQRNFELFDRYVRPSLTI